MLSEVPTTAQETVTPRRKVDEMTFCDVYRAFMDGSPVTRTAWLEDDEYRIIYYDHVEKSFVERRGEERWEVNCKYPCLTYGDFCADDWEICDWGEEGDETMTGVEALQALINGNVQARRRGWDRDEFLYSRMDDKGSSIGGICASPRYDAKRRSLIANHLDDGLEAITDAMNDFTYNDWVLIDDAE